MSNEADLTFAAGVALFAYLFGGVFWTATALIVLSFVFAAINIIDERSRLDSGASTPTGYQCRCGKTFQTGRVARRHAEQDHGAPRDGAWRDIVDEV